MKQCMILMALLILVGRLTALSCHDIQFTTDPSGDSPYAGQAVTVQGIVVAERFYTGTSSTNYGFMIGDPEGGPWSGLFVFTNQHLPARGDLVQVTGTITEYYNWTEMSPTTGFVVLSSGNPVPPPSLVTPDQLANSNTAEQWENVFVYVQNVTTTTQPNVYGEFYVTNGGSVCQIDDQCMPRSGFSWPAMPTGQSIYRILGVVDYSFNYYAINPRSLADLQYVPVTCDLAMTATAIPFWQQINTPIILNGTVHNSTDVTSNSFDIVITCNDEELARLSYQDLPAGQSLPWSHTFSLPTAGYKYLSSSVEITGDQDPDNNNASSAFIVAPDPVSGIDFGSGDTLARVPWDFYWRYSLYEAIIYPDEIGHAGFINGISFFNDFETSQIQLDLKLWIGETTAPDLASAWIPASELNLSFDNFIAFPIGANEVYIPFNPPYHYQGGNLVIMAYQTHSWYYVGYDKFHAQVLDGARSRKRYSDAYDPDPYNPPGGIDPSGEVPQIRFYMDPITAVDDPSTPALIKLGCYPNPLRSSATFKTSSPLPGANLEIYNLRGQKVASLPFGSDQISWETKDMHGSDLPAGIYLARIRDGRNSVFRKICLLGE